MESNRISIERSDGREDVLELELIVREEGLRGDPATYGRWHDIAVYRRADGMWAVQIDFGTLCVRERPHTDVEIVDRPEEVETALLLHEPTEHLSRNWIRPRYASDRRRFLARLAANYDALVDRVVGRMQPYVDSSPPPVAAASSRPTGWQGLLHLIGLR